MRGLFVLVISTNEVMVLITLKCELPVDGEKKQEKGQGQIWTSPDVPFLKLKCLTFRLHFCIGFRYLNHFCSLNDCNTIHSKVRLMIHEIGK